MPRIFFRASSLFSCILNCLQLQCAEKLSSVDTIVEEFERRVAEKSKAKAFSNPGAGEITFRDEKVVLEERRNLNEALKYTYGRDLDGNFAEKDWWNICGGASPCPHACGPDELSADRKRRSDAQRTLGRSIGRIRTRRCLRSPRGVCAFVCALRCLFEFQC